MKQTFITLLLFISLAAKGDYWTQKASFPGGARLWAISFSIGTKAYVGTGSLSTFFYNDFWEWDEPTNTWTQKANFPGAPREGASAFSIGNKGYITTGWDGVNFTLSSYYNDLWEWNQATNTWTPKANLPGPPRYVATAFAIGSKGYVGLGLSAAWNYLNDLWEYNPTTDSWIQKNNFGTGIDMVSGFVIDSSYYMGTGHDVSVVHADFWEWNLATGLWTQKANFPGTARCDAAGFSICGKGYIGTGDNWNNITLKDFWQYNPATNQWVQKTDFPTGLRRRTCDFSINGKGYVALGIDSVPYFFNDMWEYTPDSACTTGIPEELAESRLQFTLSPNPCTHNITLSLNNPIANNPITILITDATGKTIFSTRITTVNCKLPTVNFPNGIYTIQLTSGTHTATQKFVKQ